MGGILFKPFFFPAHWFLDGWRFSPASCARNEVKIERYNLQFSVQIVSMPLIKCHLGNIKLNPNVKSRFLTLLLFLYTMKCKFSSWPWCGNNKMSTSNISPHSSGNNRYDDKVETGCLGPRNGTPYMAPYLQDTQ